MKTLAFYQKLQFKIDNLREKKKNPILKSIFSLEVIFLLLLRAAVRFYAFFFSDSSENFLIHANLNKGIYYCDNSLCEFKKQRKKSRGLTTTALVIVLISSILTSTVFTFIQEAYNPNNKIQQTYAAGEGWLSGYAHRKAITIAAGAGAGTDYQVQLTIGNTTGGDFNIGGGAEVFPNDIRFTSSDEETELLYWIEDITADPIVVWVKVTEDLSSVSRDIYIYYGKVGDTTTSDKVSTFLGNATGGTVTTDGGDNIHTFLVADSGTNFTSDRSMDVEVLVVAGGGSGGPVIGGGGGAGGLIYSENFAVDAQEYSITVGVGGVCTSNVDGQPGVSGTDSIFSTLTSNGGGAGSSGTALDGGSGGSTGRYAASIVGIGTTGQGHDGSKGYANDNIGGGGGGAGAVGGISSTTVGGAGGIGLAYSISGSSIYYAGGGGGGVRSGFTPGAGGIGGGGAGGTGANGVVGTANTGGGGGGAGYPPYTTGAAGGSGIVIIRYAHRSFIATEPAFASASAEESDNTSPTATAPTATQATDGTGYVTIQTTIDDANDDNTLKFKTEYSLDGGSTWTSGDPILTSYITTSPDQATEPDIDNIDAYQVGMPTNKILTAAGANTVTIKWDTKSASNGTGAVGTSTPETNVKIRITPNDGTTDGTPVVSAVAFAVDNTPPTAGTIQINTNATYTTSKDTTLTLSVSGASEMKFSNNNSDYSTYESYDTTKSWDINNATYGGASNEGAKTVYVIFKDSFGNETTALNDNITYDITTPTNPTAAIDGQGAVDNTWNNNKDNPDFTSFTGEADTNGIAGFYVYFGTSSTGADTDNWVATDAFNPDLFSTSNTRYLRVLAKDNAGLYADPDGVSATCDNTNANRPTDSDCWATIFTHKYDILAPNTPSPASSPVSWTNTNSFDFSWSDPGDVGGSGVNNYTYSTNAGTSSTDTASTSINSLTSNAVGTKLFSVKANDNAGNSGNNGSVNFYYDNTIPINAGTVTDGNGSLDDTWGIVSDPSFSWVAGTDTGDQSGVKEYDIYWGTSSTGETITTTTSSNTYDPTAIPISTPYYLRIRTRDNALNVSAWETKFTMKYSQAPASPSSLSQTANASSLTLGSWTNDTTPTLNFTLTDPDSDTLGYIIKIDNDSNFSSPTVHYTYTVNDLVSGTENSFTTGQAAGTYTTGAESQTLAETQYYWRIQAVDVNGLTSSEITANSGAVAFGIDTTAPTNQDTVFPSFTSKQGGASVTIVSSGESTNNIWFAPTGTTIFSESTTMTKATNGIATSILSPATAGSYKLFVIDQAGNYSTQSTAILTVDTALPTIASVSSDKANGSYKAGEVIDINVIFSEAVTSTGNITITLETGVTDQTCTFAITNSTTGTCNYTVQAGDTSSDLEATISGTIKDQSSNSLTNYAPATTLATNKNLLIDTIAPTGTTLGFGTITTTSIQATVSGATDANSGLHTTPYYFDNTTAVTNSTYQTLTTWDSTTLTPNTQYTFKVKTKDTLENESAYTATQNKYTLASLPSNLSLLADSQTQITASWLANSNPAGTEYYAENTTAETNSTWTTDPSWTSSDLTCGTSYTFKVKAKNGDGTGTDWTSSDSVETDACTIPSTGGGMAPAAFNPPLAPASSTETSDSPASDGEKSTTEKTKSGFKISINEDAKYTENLKVNLSFTTGSDTVRMAISESPDFKYASQLPYQQKMKWELLPISTTQIPEEGTRKTLYAKFYTQYGVSSETVFDSIIFVKSLPIATPETSQPISKPVSTEVATNLPSSDKEEIEPTPKPASGNITEPTPEPTPIEYFPETQDKPKPVNPDWNTIETPEVKNFFPQANELSFYTEKFQSLEETFQNLNVSQISDIASRASGASFGIPNLTEILGLKSANNSTNKINSLQPMPLVDLSTDLKILIPSEIAFVSTASEKINLNSSLVLDEGTLKQKISTSSSTNLKIAIKPDQPTSSISGYLALKKSSYSMNDDNKVSGIQNLKSKILSLLGFKKALAEEASTNPQEIEQRFVLAQFQYFDLDQDGIWTTDIQTPAVAGEYEIISLINYQDQSIAPKEVRLITVIDPEGYVYRTEDDGVESRLPNVSVSIYQLNSDTNKYELWNAENYDQINPQITDATGRYSFLVPTGTYYVTAQATEYHFYQSESFEVSEAKNIHLNLELIPEWSIEREWEGIAIGVLVMLVLLILYRDRKKVKRKS